MTSHVAIALGESGPSFSQRVGPKVRVVHSTPHIDTYQIDWERPRGSVSVGQGKHAFVVEDVLGLQAVQELGELQGEGINEVTVFAGMSVPDPGLVSHDEARVKIHALLQRILNAGWQQVIERDEPRLQGQARLDYMLATRNGHGLDASHLPSLQDWMRVPSRTPWSFYAEGQYLELSFTREASRTDPGQAGAYLLTFTLKSEVEHFRSYAGPTQRLKWKGVVAPELAQAAAERARKEAALRAQGVPINTAYQDPPVPALN